MITISYELDLTKFEFWAGAIDNVNYLTDTMGVSWERLEELLEEVFCEGGATETCINDLFWHDIGMLCEWLEIPNYDEIYIVDYDIDEIARCDSQVEFLLDNLTEREIFDFLLDEIGAVYASEERIKETIFDNLYELAEMLDTADYEEFEMLR